MKTLRFPVLIAFMMLAGCKTHLRYDYYAPTGPGIVVSDLTDRIIAGRDEYLKVPLVNSVLYIGCGDSRLVGAYPVVNFVHIASGPSGTVPPFRMDDLAKIKLSYHAHGQSSVHHRVELHAFTSERAEASLWLTDLPTGKPSFEMTIPSGIFRETEIRIIFTRKRADYWDYVQLQ